MTHELIWAVLFNLVAGVLLGGTYFFQTAAGKAVYSILVLAAWCGFVLLIRYGRKLNLDRIIDVGCKFLPFAPFFWIVREHRRMLKAERELVRLRQEGEREFLRLKQEAEREIARLKDLVSAWPDPHTIHGLVDPKQQEKSLNIILDEMGVMADARLSTIVDRIRHSLADILHAATCNGNYILFRQVIEKLSTYRPEDHPETYVAFLCLLQDILSLDPAIPCSRRLKQDVVDPMMDALRQAGTPQHTRVKDLIQHIMNQAEDENELARRVLTLLPELNWERQIDVSQVIFDAAKDRALRYPSRFGHDFLKAIGTLEHRVFWLSAESIREILEKSPEGAAVSLIGLNQVQYKELCSTIFAEPGRHNRVFRRLVQDAGQVKIECILEDGSQCTCDAHSLSFRGFYSGKCAVEVGKEVRMDIVPVTNSSKRFSITGRIAPLHTNPQGQPVSGRGVFFAQADESTLRELYHHILAVRP